MSTNPFREDLPQCSNYGEHRFLTPTANAIDIVKAAAECARQIYRPGFSYKRAGVIVMSIDSCVGIQTSFIDYDAERFQKMRKLDEVVDRINKVSGTETIILGSQQYPGKGGGGKSPKFEEAMKRDFRSPYYTTRWSDIITLK
jgi:DNA polymerase V